MADNTILWNIRGLSFEQRSVHIYQESWIYAPYTWATDVRSERPQKSTTVSFYLHHNLSTGTNSNSNTILLVKHVYCEWLQKLQVNQVNVYPAWCLLDSSLAFCNNWFESQYICSFNHLLFFFIVTSGFFVLELCSQRSSWMVYT